MSQKSPYSHPRPYEGDAEPQTAVKNVSKTSYNRCFFSKRDGPVVRYFAVLTSFEFVTSNAPDIRRFITAAWARLRKYDSQLSLSFSLSRKIWLLIRRWRKRWCTDVLHGHCTPMTPKTCRRSTTTCRCEQLVPPQEGSYWRQASSYRAVLEMTNSERIATTSPTRHLTLVRGGRHPEAS